MIVNTDIDVGIDLICEKCGKSLSQTDEDINELEVVIKVEPCHECTSIEYNTGHTKGFDKGLDDGMKLAKDDISNAINEELKDFDFDELFKQSEQAKVVREAIDLILTGHKEMAAVELSGIV